MLFAFRPSSVKRLLIIEDDPLIAFDNEYALKQHGYEVIATVESGEAAVPFIADVPLDALILDMELAGHMTGRDVARLAKDRKIPVLLVTGKRPDDVADFAISCLHKPHTPALLLSALRGLDMMIAKRKMPRKIRGIETFWRPEII
ncbi:response regulator [Sphingopyxis yananensis]|uniref:response regulator n=1 Tax=Sphingopyxis yananensis TaxID=2886687 RepID=UPI001D109A5D|nr:response regulator [Sphingopyxis yananensis]MCC2600914.1 response regulator [Sphingopyxis yananensis]